MKTLLVFRHAKSSWKDATLDDHDRPLNKRGKKAVALMSQLIAGQKAVPDLILSSTAKRARSTAKKAAKAMGYEGNIHYDKTLYMATASAYVKAIQRYATTHNRVMIVGHNPGLEDLIEAITGQAQSLPTGALAELRLDIQSWQDLQPETTGNLNGLWLPRELSM